MATPEEVLRMTGYRIGTVSPFGLPERMRVLVEKSTLFEQEISIGSGEAGTGILMFAVDLMRALPGAEEVDLIEST